jgi:hypothetical protein
MLRLPLRDLGYLKGRVPGIDNWAGATCTRLANAGPTLPFRILKAASPPPLYRPAGLFHSLIYFALLFALPFRRYFIQPRSLSILGDLKK